MRYNRREMRVSLFTILALAAGCASRTDVVGRVVSADATGDGAPASGMRLNLELWNPGDPSGGKEYRLAVRITNWDGAPVEVDRLAVRAWFRYSGPSPLEGLSFDEAQSVYNREGSWQRNLRPTLVSFAEISPVRDCGDNRTASWAATITFDEGAGVQIDPGGGYVECNHDANTLGSWHRQDWAPLDFSQDYSRITDAANSAAERRDLAQFALYLDGRLVEEWRSATERDPQTGREPCP